MVVRVSVVGSHQEYGVIFYEVKVVNESGREWIVPRRYNHFVELSTKVKADGKLSEIELPGKAVLNLGRAIATMGFIEERRRQLEQYLEHLASQVQTVAQNPALESFLMYPRLPPIESDRDDQEADRGALEGTASPNGDESSGVSESRSVDSSVEVQLTVLK